MCAEKCDKLSFKIQSIETHTDLLHQLARIIQIPENST